MAVINIEKAAEILKEGALTYILPRYERLEDHEISSKTTPGDLVTQADIEMEDYLKRRLPDLLPASRVIGEEGVSKGEDNLDILNDESQKIWVVDPVDGTRNFVHGRPEFGAMMACIIGGKTQVALIYDILSDNMYMAERGAGGFVNSQRLAVSKTQTAEDMTAHINYHYFPEPLKGEMKVFMERFKHQGKLGSSAHEYARLSSGVADLSFYSRSRIWDNLPGALILEESGGAVIRHDGKAFTPKDDFAHLIAANSLENAQLIREKLLESTSIQILD